jgi:hypothetical protein
MRISLFLALVFLTAFVRAAAEPPNTIEDDLSAAFEKIASARGVTKDEVIRKAQAMWTDSPWWPVKGGVAIIRDGMFLIVNGKKNGVSASDTHLNGSDPDVPELFVFSEKKIVGSIRLAPGDGSDVVVVLFTPERVRIFDWKNLDGGFYPRHLKK